MSTPVLDVDTIILVEVIIKHGPFLQLISPFSCVVVVELQVILILLCWHCMWLCWLLLCEGKPTDAEECNDFAMELASKHKMEM